MPALNRIAYRLFRAVKLYALRNPAAGGRLFFRSYGMLERALSGRRADKMTGVRNALWKAVYAQRFENRTPYRLETEAPVADYSDDHKLPHGTLYDNSTNRRFNLQLYRYFRYRPDLAVLDLGCSGGGFVKSVIEDGYRAAGVEGSDISRRLRSAEWDTIPKHLFTADITQPFTLTGEDGAAARFHCVTAWEVLEHIPERLLPGLLDNVRRHLAPDGIFVASVALFRDENPLTGAVYHVTLMPREWWIEQFTRAGFAAVEGHPFEDADYVRGHGQGIKDWSPAEGDGFHLVMRHAAPAA